MFSIAALIALSVVFVEGATELVCKSSIFKPFRKSVSALSPFFKELLSCGYCTSFWVATAPAAFLAFRLAGSFVSFGFIFLFMVVVLQRLSNFTHNISDKHFDKYYANNKDS
jgi:hypothetical protein